ncbi:MAG: exodeoxyribonuclease V subunit gamma, partial [Rudaea sp.]
MAGRHGNQQDGDARNADRGLFVFRASRMDALLGPLDEMFAATKPRNVLAPHTLIAAHPGVRQWLSGALARRHGRHGIVANLDVLLPSAWIERQAQLRLERKAISLPRYAQRLLRWTIHSILAGDLAHAAISDARVRAFLGDRGAAVAQRRFQLADRLARIYSQYLVYRPDWLGAWERGRLDFVTASRGDGALERELLAPLWRALHERLGPHRGTIVDELIRKLAQASASEGEAVHVFGVSHLAPNDLAVLRAASLHRVVALYVPDPCREYWGGIAERSGLAVERSEEDSRIDAAGGEEFWSPRRHPLLSRWGRLGQHFMLSLDELDAVEDIRHRADEVDAEPAVLSRLGRLQQSIRAADPAIMAVDLDAPGVRGRELEDASLRVHACHTRLRELEVLRENVLDAIEAGSRRDALRPAQIVVMAPNIHDYVALIPVVFGAPGNPKATLPYHMADIPLAGSHPLFDCLERLLGLPASRITAPEVADLLELADVGRRLGIDESGLRVLIDWLRESRVAWGFDAGHRAALGLPAVDECTFGWAADRMIGGYLMNDASVGDAREGVRFADGSELLPLRGIEGPDAECVGALDGLLRTIRAFCVLARGALRASEWSDAFERFYTSLVRVDPLDDTAREANAAVLRAIRELAAEPLAAGVDPELEFAVVRDLLSERLAAVPERQRFLMGGITFCGMVPRRAIPFRMIAVLGLNEGEFPRSESDGGLDLMTRHRRLGDRDVRSDDRYLFLETLMAAGERLHLSYIGEGVRDGKRRNPAAPLAELLEALGPDGEADRDGAQRSPPWLVRHPLQPFDARYFDGSDARVFSFNEALADMRGGERRGRLERFYDPAQANAVEVDSRLTLRELRGYFKDPARQVLAQRMRVRLDALDDDRLRDEEPLETRLEALDRVTQRLFFNATDLDAPPPAWLRLGGLLPAGAAARRAWQEERAKVMALRNGLQQLAGVDNLDSLR